MTMRSMFCLVAVTVSCTANLTGENTPNGSADLPRKLEMHQRFVALGAIQDAIVDGDLAMAKTYAVAIQAGDFRVRRFNGSRTSTTLRPVPSMSKGPVRSAKPRKGR
ncbi:MAG: hypothetical protein AAGJ56_02975 [Myxococcota bacterium]